MLRPSVYQAASIFAALALYALVEDRIKGTAHKLVARGDVWTAGYHAGYDRGYEEGRRLIAVPKAPPRSVQR